MNDIHKNLTLYINVRKPMKKKTDFSIFSCFIMLFVTLIVALTTIVLQLQELRTQFKCISTTTETSLSNLDNYNLITWSDTFTRRLQRLKRDNKEQQDEEKGETLRQSEEESEKQQQSKEEDEKQRRNKEKEETWRQNEEKTEERQSEKKSKIQRQYEEKGEKRRQNRRGHKHKRRRPRPLVATFIGAIPEQLTSTGVYSAPIGPWIKSENKYHKYDLTKFHLVEDNMSIQVDTSGLYMISIQIYYFGHSMNYTYWLLLNSEGSSTKQKLITCTTSGNEVSCYTSVVTYLNKGDRLSLQQQEKNRLINLRKGYSQIQIMMLANDKKLST